MDCNKEEASRAKDIAEKKMQIRDFVGAKKFLLKALQLSPDIENASHMLTVCEVHCSAGSLVNGQTDHYGVLQVDVSADEALIRKQYRKLALLLHPDKNKFAGAEAAFKLVGEAYKVLSDQTNRQVYDSKRRVIIRTTASWQPSQNARNVRRYTAATINVSNNQYVGPKPQDQQPPTSFFVSQCFWTMCVFCNNRFQYSRAWLNREVQCQKCYKKFHAFEVSPQNVPPPGSSSGFAWNHTGLHETSMPVQHAYNHGNQTHQSQPLKPESATVHCQKVNPCADGMTGNLKSENTKPQNKPSSKPLSGKSHRMRNRRVVKSSDSESAKSDSSDSISEVDTVVPDSGPTSSRYPRRSTRSKINVTYKEVESEEDDFGSRRKRLRKVGSFGFKNQGGSSPKVATNGVKINTTEGSFSEGTVKAEQTGHEPFKDGLPKASVQGCGMMHERRGTIGKSDEKQVGEKSNATSAFGSRSSKPQTISSFSFPDPEFYDFDNDRHQSSFAVNQIWAVYDDADGMPRFYALINKIFTPNFKLQFIWLENNPISAAEKAWVSADLPIACGNFSLGKTSTARSQEMFSHLIFTAEKSRENIYFIYPKQGEVWALFKDWDVGWSSPEKRPGNYMYEFVEVISNFAYGKDIRVSHLVKVNGFRYVFAPVHDKGNTIPSGQLLKFSHRIPSYKVCEDREGIPRGSFELDPAALPESYVITDKVSAETVEVSDTKFADPFGSVKDISTGSEANHKNLRYSECVFEADGKMAGVRASTNSDEILHKASSERRRCKVKDSVTSDDDETICSDADETPNSEFFNFQDVRSEEKFEQGQLWALYSDIDEYPNYYAWIRKVEWEESGCITVKWLEHSPETQAEQFWHDNGLAFSCGKFKVVPGIDQFTTTDTFSHMVLAKPMKKNELYEIYPNRGEIWAAYKNWSIMWTPEDVQKVADFDVIEIVERNEYAIKAVTLTKVKGYNYVFKPMSRGVTNIVIPIEECLRFSHQIPAFRLTEQASAELQDCWELDPDSIPKILLLKNSS